MDEHEGYKAFELLARKYCTTLTSAVEQDDFDLMAVQDSLLNLYTAATRLPPITTRTGVKPEHPDDQLVSHSEWQTLYHHIGKCLPFDEYWDTFDPLSTKDREPACSTLADDLADVWRDIINGLRSLDAHGAATRQNVWWEWRFSFHTHWGAHAIGALRAIHHYLRDKE
jgi:hypothetical protein